MNKNSRILIACEESQIVTNEFRKLGFYNTFSCDILPTSGLHPEWHICNDVLNILGKNFWNNNEGWDMMIAHPPCTYLSKAGTRWLFPNKKLNQERYEKGLQAKDFFMKFLNADIPIIVVENPVPHKIFEMPKETQIIQPCEFGHKLKKATCLWIKGLPKLKSTDIVEPEFYIDKKGIRHTKLTGWSAKRKSKTFPGIAKAIATQWGSC